MAHHEEHDVATGKTTTGHEWDGIKELNTPLPRWWVYLFYATIVWSIGYWVVYPAWPTISGHTAGWFSYSTRAQVRTELTDLERLRGEKSATLATASTSNIVQDPALLALARARGKVAFADNCAPCHGSGGAGAKGYPNLNDDDWLWGGTLADIQQTLEFGVRAGHTKGREGAMMAFGGKDGILKPAEIKTVANFVRSLSGLSVVADTDLDAGRKLFATNCAACHGDDGRGKLDVGAPNLADKIWLYGSDEAAIIESITNGRGGVMPAWNDRLDPVTLKSLVVYVYSLGGGK